MRQRKIKKFIWWVYKFPFRKVLQDLIFHRFHSNQHKIMFLTYEFAFHWSTENSIYFLIKVLMLPCSLRSQNSTNFSKIRTMITLRRATNLKLSMVDQSSRYPSVVSGERQTPPNVNTDQEFIYGVSNLPAEETISEYWKTWKRT